MPVTLDAVLARRELQLRLIWADDSARARAWGWVHSSDLADPTPFLSPGDALLTTGTQWASDDDIAPWVARLAEAGVPAVGFGTEVIRDGTPDALAEACAAHGIALLEVPYRTPFIAVARAVADLDAEERYARVRWTLETQRAIAVAALRPTGLAAVVAELARRIGAEAGIVGANGDVLGTTPPAAVLDEALGMLRAGRRAARAVDDWSLQTVGAATALTGVLAIGPGSPHDDAERAVVTSVVALAGLAGVADTDALVAEAAETAGRLAALRSAVQAALVASEPSPALAPAPRDPDDPAALVQPLLEHDALTGDDLIGTLGTWLRCDAVAEAAALRLGIHRHTVRARLRRAAELLERDLDAFPARAEVWTALQAIGRA
ncbi:PucR family transcriptional regulator [Microcella humidisoli]|uniref:PucR family transcriptional regulator n=1 Tax=Microcella humidisoli TaxID=2963406 RepID=A0ABY5FWR6_9MICO|nr:PucR family transcriptional regulator [Microcella humidisoli]UTT62757.1 PucR family transcriptional regulator [Microcella humidisoli]